MKEAYFTVETMSECVLEMSRELESFRQARAARFHPSQSALLVLDMQSYFIEQASHACVPSAAAILPGIMALIEAYKSRNFPIVFTRHLNIPQDAGRMADWWHDLIRPDDPRSAFAPELDTSTGSVVVKSQYDAFHGTDLEKMLRDRHVTQVVICGVMTHLCCETTARSAFVRGFEVFFPIDGSATYNREFHRATLLNLAHGFAAIPKMDELLLEVKAANAN